MNLLSEYDCVIIGEHPAGLWAAKHLLDLGMTVLIIPTETHGGGNVLPKKVAEAFQMGAGTELQIITPTRRTRLVQSIAELKDEYRFNYGSELSKDQPPHPDFFRGVAYWVRGAETGPLLPDQWPALYAKLFETVYFDEPTGYLVDVLLRALEKQGAYVVKPGQLRQIFTDQKRVVGVQLSGTSKMIAVKTIFANTQFDYINQFLNEKLPQHSAPIGWNFEISFECSTEFLPIGLTPRMIYVQKDAPVLELFQEWLGRFRLKTTVPFQDFTLDRGNQHRLASRMLKVCEDLLPDLQYNLKRVTPDLRDPERAITTELPAIYPFETLSKIPPALLTYGAGTGLGFQSSVQGLYLSGDEVNPRDGFWGAFEAVEKAFEAWAKRDQRPELGRISLK